MNKKVLWIIIALVILAGGFYFLSDGEITGNVVADNLVEGSNVKTFVLTGENFKFMMNGIESPEIKVKQGDKVRIEFTSTTGFHDWKVDEFNAATEKVNAGESSFIEFTADKKGSFEYYCSIGQHRKNGMKGNLIVE
ncbi:MAG: cupredoxin domain-containing protein [Nanoarchaeota archaeon]|nr:cupredoxin domain-containing protein [Nanoarchaeota archaeon]